MLHTVSRVLRRSGKLVSGSASWSLEQESDRWAELSGVTSGLPPAGAVHQHHYLP